MIKPKRVTVVQETEYGLYYWELPSGRRLSDGEGRFLCAEGKAHDVTIMKDMAIAAASYGYPDGKCVWVPGDRKVTDNMHDDQMERLLDGKIPDPYGIDMQNEIKKRGKW